MADPVRFLGINLAVSGLSDFTKDLDAGEKALTDFSATVTDFGKQIAAFDTASTKIAAGVKKIRMAMTGSSAIGNKGFAKGIDEMADAANSALKKVRDSGKNTASAVAEAEQTIARARDKARAPTNQNTVSEFLRGMESVTRVIREAGDAAREMTSGKDLAAVDSYLQHLVKVFGVLQQVRAYTNDTTSALADMRNNLRTFAAERQFEFSGDDFISALGMDKILKSDIFADRKIQQQFEKIQRQALAGMSSVFRVGPKEQEDLKKSGVTGEEFDDLRKRYFEFSDMIKKSTPETLESVLDSVYNNVPKFREAYKTVIATSRKTVVEELTKLKSENQRIFKEAELGQKAAAEAAKKDYIKEARKRPEKFVPQRVLQPEELVAFKVLTDDIPELGRGMDALIGRMRSLAVGAGASDAAIQSLMVGMEKHIAPSFGLLGEKIALGIDRLTALGVKSEDISSVLSKSLLFMSRQAGGDPKQIDAIRESIELHQKRAVALQRYGEVANSVSQISKAIPEDAKYLAQAVDILADNLQRGTISVADFARESGKIAATIAVPVGFDGDRLVKDIGEATGQVDLSLGKLVEKFRSEFPNALNAAIDTLVGSGHAKDVTGDVGEVFGIRTIEGIRDGIARAAQSSSASSEIKGAIVKIMSDAISDIENAGMYDPLAFSPAHSDLANRLSREIKEVSEGVGQGISQQSWEQYGAFAAEEFVHAVKKTLGIHSPSTVMASQVGIPMAEGMLSGLRDGLIGDELKEIINEATSILGITLSENLEDLTFDAAKKMASDLALDVGKAGFTKDSARLMSRALDINPTDSNQASGKALVNIFATIRDLVREIIPAMAREGAKVVAEISRSASSIVSAISSRTSAATGALGGAGAGGASGAGGTSGTPLGFAPFVPGSPPGAPRAPGVGTASQYELGDPYGRMPHPSSAFDANNLTNLAFENLQRRFALQAERIANDATSSVDVAMQSAGATLDPARAAELKGFATEFLSRFQESLVGAATTSWDSGDPLKNLTNLGTSLMTDFQEQIEYIDKELSARKEELRSNRSAKRSAGETKRVFGQVLDITSAKDKLDRRADELDTALTSGLQRRRRELGDARAFAGLDKEMKDYIATVRERTRTEVEAMQAAGFAPEQIAKAVGFLQREITAGQRKYMQRIKSSTAKGEIGSGAQSEIRSINAQIKQRNENLKKLIETYGSGSPEIKTLYLDILKQNSMDQAAMQDAIKKADRSTAAGPAMQKKNLAAVNAAARVETDRLNESAKRLGETYRELLDVESQANGATHDLALTLGASASTFKDFLTTFDVIAGAHKGKIDIMLSSGSPKALIDRENEAFDKRTKNAKANAIKLKEAYGAIDKARTKMENSARELSPAGAQGLRDNFESEIAPFLQALNNVRFDSLPNEVAEMVAAVIGKMSFLKSDVSSTVTDVNSSITKLQTQINNLGKWRDTMTRSVESSDLTKAGKKGALGEIDRQYERILRNIQGATDSALAAQGLSFDEFIVNTKDQIARAEAQIDKMLTDPKGMSFRRRFSAVNAAYADATSRFVDISKITYQEFKKFRDAEKELAKGDLNDRMLKLTERLKLFVYGFRYGHPYIMAFGRALLFVGKQVSGTFAAMLSISGQALSTLVFNVIPKGIRGFANLGKAISTIVVSDFVGMLSKIGGAIGRLVGKFGAIPAGIAKRFGAVDVFTGTFDRLRRIMGGLEKEERDVVAASNAAKVSVTGFGDAAAGAAGDVNTLTGSTKAMHASIVNSTKSSKALNTASKAVGGDLAVGMGQGFAQAISMNGNNIFAGGLNKATILTGVGLSIGASLVRGVINSIQNAGYQVRNAFRQIFTRGIGEFMTREAVQGSLSFGVLDDLLRDAYKAKGGITNATKGTEEYAAALKESKIQGQELYKWLSQLAVLSPFSKEEIQPLLKMALGSFDKENAKSIVATGIDVASVSQNAQDAEAYVRALSQIGASGFLKKEDLNQINNMMAGNQILLDNLIDKDTKLPRFTTTGEMLDAITKKSITATEAIEAFQKGASLIFGGAAAEMGGSLKGLTSSISDAINERLADSLTPVIEETVKPLMAFFFTALRSGPVVEFFKGIGESLATFAGSLLEAFARISAFAGAIKDMIPPSVLNGIGMLLTLGTAATVAGIAIQSFALILPIVGAGLAAFLSPMSLLIGGLFALYRVVSSVSSATEPVTENVSLFGDAVGAANEEIQALKETAASSIRPLVALGVGALDLFGDVQRGTKGSQSRWEKFSADFKAAVDTNITKPLAKMRVDFGKWLLSWAQWWQAMAKTAWENIKKIPQMLIDVGSKMYSYGKNIILWLAQGIVDGASYVVDAVLYIGNVIGSWMSPGSPPKFLPDIDKWGRETADVYLEGWTKADFGLVKDIASTITGYLSSDDGQLENKEIDKIYNAVAQAVSKFKETGVFDTIGIEALTGDLSVEMARLAQAYTLAAKSAAEMAAAQADLETKTKEYEDVLKGMNKQLDILKGDETAADIENQVKELQRVLSNAYATTQQRQLATNKIAQLRLEQEIAATEKKRDAELATIQERIDLSTKENKTATEALDLMKERLDLSYSVGKKDAPGGGGGDTADTGVDKPDKGKEGAPEETELDLPKVPKMDLGTDELTKRIEEMKKKVTTALDDAKTAIGKKGEDIKKTLGEVRDSFMLGWGGGQGGESGVPQKAVMDVVGFSAGVTVDDTIGVGIVGMIADVGAAASIHKPKVDELTKSVNAARTEFTNAYNETPGSFIDKVFAGFNTKTIQEKIASAKSEIKGLSDYVKSEEFKANVELQIGKINLDTASKSLTGFRDKVIAEINSYTVEDKSLDGFRDEMVTTLGETDLSPTAMTDFATNMVKHAGLAFGLVSMAGLAGSILSALIPALGKVGWTGVAGALATAIAGGIGALGPIGWIVVGAAVAAAIGAAVSSALDIDFSTDPKATGDKIQDTVSQWSDKASTMVANFVNWIAESIEGIDWAKLAGIAGYTTVTLFAALGQFVVDAFRKIEWGKLLYNTLKAAAEIIGGFIVGAFVGGVDAYERENKELEEAGKRLAEDGERPFVNVLTRLANFIASVTTRISLLLDKLPIVGGFLDEDQKAAMEKGLRLYAEGAMPYTPHGELPDLPTARIPGAGGKIEPVPGASIVSDALTQATDSLASDPLVSSVLKRNEEQAKETRSFFANMFGAVEEESKTTGAAIAGHISSGISQVDYNTLFGGMTPAGRDSGTSASGEIKSKIDATKIDAPIIYGPLKKEATVKAKEAAGEFLTSFSAFANMPQFQRTQKDIGGGVIHGIVSGMNEVAMAVDDSLGGSLSTLLGKALTYLGIESPSKKTHEEIGIPMGQGILLGTSEALKETEVLLKDVNLVFTDITTEATTVLDAFFLASTQSWVTYTSNTELQWISLKDRILLVADQLKVAMSSKIQELADASRTIVDGIIAYFSTEEYVGKWYAVGDMLGTAIGTGIADGMKGDEVKGAIEVSAGVLINLVKQELKDKAGVDSPSKVMAAEVGRPLGLGVIQGMAQTGAEAQTAAGNFVAMMLAASMKAINGGSTLNMPQASSFSAETELRVPNQVVHQYNLYMSVTPSQAERINDNFRIMEIMS